MTTPPEFVAPAWLLAAADQRIALMEEVISSVVDEGVDIFHGLTGFTPSKDVDLMAKVLEGNIMMTPLVEPYEGATREELERWERTCDNCGAYCPDGQLFFTGHLAREWHSCQVLVMFGMCPLCKDTP